MDFYIGFGIYVDENSWLADKLVLGRLIVIVVYS